MYVLPNKAVDAAARVARYYINGYRTYSRLLFFTNLMGQSTAGRRPSTETRSALCRRAPIPVRRGSIGHGRSFDRKPGRRWRVSQLVVRRSLSQRRTGLPQVWRTSGRLRPTLKTCDARPRVRRRQFPAVLRIGIAPQLGSCAIQSVWFIFFFHEPQSAEILLEQVDNLRTESTGRLTTE